MINNFWSLDKLNNLLKKYKISKPKIITAIGVIGAGAAPLSVFDSLFALLPQNGFFAFSFNDHTLNHPNYEKKVEKYLSLGHAKIIHKSYGNHLPKVNLKSNIYILKKL